MTQKSVILQRNIPADIYWQLKKTAVERNISFNEAMLEAWSEYITSNKELLNK